MSVRVREYKRSKNGGGYEVDIRLRQPNGKAVRKGLHVHASTKAKAREWAERKLRELETAMLDEASGRCLQGLTLAEFAPQFINGYARAKRQKPSGIAAKEGIINNHLIPTFGKTRLNEIDDRKVAMLMASLKDRSPKTVNNVLSVLKRMLDVAVEWKLIRRLPCTVRLLKVTHEERDFLSFDDYDRLLSVAKAASPLVYRIVLLGAEAGLRCGEMLALDWNDARADTGKITVSKSCWRGHITAPKNGKVRHIKMTPRLRAALQNDSGQIGPVLVDGHGNRLTLNGVRSRLRGVMKRAGVKHGVHILRHTFCSHLAMLKVEVGSIQRLAGHQSVMTTQRYMHLSANMLDDAIDTLGARP